MLLEIVAGLLGSQLIRTVAFDVATGLLCQIIQSTVTTVARPRGECQGSETDASPAPAAPADAPSPVSTDPTPRRLRALPSVEVIASVAGRVRLRVPGVRDDAAYAA